MANDSIQVQEIVLEYFEGYDNNIVIGIIDIIVYRKTNDSVTVNMVLENFLKDNGLVTTFENYIIDATQPDRSWKKMTSSQQEMMQNIIDALMNLVYNRFRILKHGTVPVSPDKVSKSIEPKPAMAKKLPEPEKTKFLESGEIHIVTPLGLSDYTICGMQIGGNYNGEANPTKEKTTCPDCIKLAKFIKKHSY